MLAFSLVPYLCFEMADVPTYDIEALQINPDQVLDECSERVACSECNKKVKFFCYLCHKPIPSLEHKIPSIRLPFKLDVIKHKMEGDGKSTAIHAKIVAPEDVDIVQYEEGCLEGADLERTALLFPGPDAENIADIDPASFDKVLVIDGTWSQAKSMINKNSAFLKMRKVTVNPRKTRFWRYQTVDDSYMATIEAIYFLYRDQLPREAYDGRYDALLYFFKYFYNLIQSRYNTNPEITFHSKHQKGYISYNNSPTSPSPSN